MVSKSAFVEIFIIKGLKSDAILSVVDRNVAIFTTQHAIVSTIVLIFQNHFYGCKKPSTGTSDI